MESRHSNGSAGALALGMLALENGDVDEALRIARDLRKVDEASGLLLEAVALEDTDLALSLGLAERAILAAPDSWEAWHTLGNLYSHDNNLEKALECYSQALNQSGCDEGVVGYNQAVANFQAGNHDLGFAIMRSVPGPTAKVARLAWLNQLERYPDVLRESRPLLDDQEVLSDGTLVGQVLFEKAAALRALGRSQEGIEWVLKSLWHNKFDTDALRLLRELRGEGSEEAGLYEVVIEGPWDSEVHNAGEGFCRFSAAYEVVAVSDAHAVELAVSLEPEQVRGFCDPTSVERVANARDELLGVVEAHPYDLFDQEDA